MPDSRETRILFETDAVPEGTLIVASLEGEERISSLYRFEVTLISEDPEIDLDAVLSRPARIVFEREGEEPRTVHGVLQCFEQGDSGPVFTGYRAVLVPRLWWLALSSANQVYQDSKTQDVLSSEFKAGGLAGTDFEFLLDGPRSAVTHEYVVQYNESNLDFVQRRMEQDGYFYLFSHGENEPGEKLLVCDRSGRVPPIPGDAPVPYRVPSGLDEPEQESLFSWRCRLTPVPEKVLLRDYNYRTPKVDLSCEAPVKDGDLGHVYEYGAHYKNTHEGRDLAMIRAEECRSNRERYRGESHCIRMTAGHSFALIDHPRGSFNQSYLLVSVKHRVLQSTPGDAVRELTDAPGLAYRNEIEAIPLGVPYRPPRTTPVPRLVGIMNAVVEGETSSPYAEIDAMGRYRVRLAFDVGEAGAGKASRYLRMASPYAGESEGATFPLRKGTEVLWACIDGDPDRPVILGAVPNPDTPNRVTEQNRSKSIIQTASGVLIEFNDSIPG